MNDIKNENNSLLKTLRMLLVSTPFLFTLVYIPQFILPGNFPRTIFLHIAVSMVLTVWLLYIYKSHTVVFKKNWLNKAILVYTLIFFVSGLAGGHFIYSLFGDYARMVGTIYILYITGWYIVASSVLRPRDWINIFRTLLFSGFVLAIFSFLGVSGFNLKAFNFFDQGGSLFLNDTFSGIYYLFAFFFGVFLLVKEASFKWRISYIFAMLVIISNPDIFNFQLWQNPSLFQELFSNPSFALGTARASSATIVLGIIISAMMYLIHRVHRISVSLKCFLFGIIFSIILVSSISFVWSVTMQKGFGHNILVDQKDYQRPIIWNYGIEAFKNKPFLGYGPNGFEYAFQDSLTPDISFLKGGKWADRVHNGWLDPLVETGIFGILGMIAIFIAACWHGFKYYRQTKDFSAPIVLLLFVLHMIQIQTSFNTNTSLFMIFILLAYMASLESSNVSYVLSRPTKTLLLSIGSGIILVSMIFTAIIPARYSYSIPSAMASGNFNKRMSLYKSLQSFYGYPPEVIRAVVESYTNYILGENFDDSSKEYVKKQAMIEYDAMLDLYEAHYHRYDDNLRYIINYVNTIYIARFFDVERMDRAGELITRAKELSANSPQVYWEAALYAKYTGNKELAFQEISKAIEMAESSHAKFEEIQQLDDFYDISLDLSNFLKRTKNSNKKVYFFLKRI